MPASMNTGLSDSWMVCAMVVTARLGSMPATCRSRGAPVKHEPGGEGRYARANQIVTGARYQRPK